VEHAQEYGLKQGWHAVNQSDSGWTALKVRKCGKTTRAPNTRAGNGLRHIVLAGGSQGSTTSLDARQSQQSGLDVPQRRPRWLGPRGQGISKLLDTTRRRRVCRPELWRRQRHRDTGDICRSSGGLYADVPTIGFESGERAWTPLDANTGASREYPERHGVVSWGPAVSSTPGKRHEVRSDSRSKGRAWNSWDRSRELRHCRS